MSATRYVRIGGGGPVHESGGGPVGKSGSGPVGNKSGGGPVSASVVVQILAKQST